MKRLKQNGFIVRRGFGRGSIKIPENVNAFTLLEALIALIASGLISICFVLVLQTCVHMINQDINHQDQFSILQIRQIAALSDYCKVENEWLVCSYMKSDISIGFDKNRLVKIDGYEIFMEGINYASFYEKGEGIYLEWNKTNKTYQVQIK